MADSFDPWHVWLGVSPQQQPPNHYRLLGIDVFEHNEDVIDTAASRQSVALREQSSGEFADQAGQILTQIVTARACLLNGKHRKKYDRQLIRELTGHGEELPAAAKVPTAEPGYHLWLGIPPTHQPPDHYRLLGIETFEASPEVIEAGAARQTTYLREVSTGPDRKLSQQLLNDVAAARRCLLDTEKKSLYDEQLKRGAQQAAEAGTCQDDSTPVADAEVADAEVADAEVADAEVAGGPDMSAVTGPAFVQTVPASDLTPENPLRNRGSLQSEKRKSAVWVGVAGCLGLLVLAGLIRSLGGLADGEPVVAVRPESSDGTGPESGTGESEETQATQQNAPGAGLDGLLGHWSFDEKNADWAKNSVTPLPVVLHGRPEFRDGPLGFAVRCQGPEQFLELPAGALEAHAGTIAFWVRPEKHSESGNELSLVSTTGQGTSIDLQLTSGGLIRWSLGIKPKPVDVTVGLEPDVWFHLTLAWSRNGEAWLYCNAKQIGTAEGIGKVGLPVGVRMGSTLADVSFDDVRCFNRALDEQEIRTLIKSVTIELKAPVPVSLKPEETLAAVDRTSAADATGVPATDDSVPQQPDRKKARRQGSRKKQARPPAPPEPPAAREVIFPEASSHAVSQIWKNLDTASVDGLSAVIRKNTDSQRRNLKSLATGVKAKLGAKSGQRVRGFLVPPLSGVYTFQVQFQEQGTFRLSRNQSAGSKRPVTDGEEIELAADQTYYFEVLHVNVGGAGTFQVGWTLPNGSQEKTIPAARLRWTPHLIRFTRLPVESFEASAGLKLRRVEKTQRLQVAADPTVASSADSTITIDSVSDMTTYSAFRLDALYDPELNPEGTGLGTRGSFEIREVRLSYQEPGSDEFVPVPLAAPVAHSGIPERLVDGDDSTTWRVSRRPVTTTSVILVPVDRLIVPPRTKLRFELKQKSSPGLLALSGTVASADRQVKKLQAAIAQEKKPYELLVNLGDTDWTDPRTNKKWLRTKEYQTGSWGHSGGKLKEKKEFSAPAGMLKTACEGISAFRADVPNGEFEVTLYFFDHWSTRAAERTFTVQLESEKAVQIDARQQSVRLLSDIPPRRMKVKVIDRRLDISFKKKKGSRLAPILSAVRIVRSR